MVTTRSVVLTFLIGVLFLLLFALAPPARSGSRPDPVQLDIGDLTLSVTPSILERSDGSRQLADNGSTFFAYIDSTQHRIDWWAVEIIPTDPAGDFMWSTGQRLSLISTTELSGSVPVVDFILATGCEPRRYERCRSVFPFRGIVIPYAAVTVPQKSPRIQGYVGTKRGSIQPQSVAGLTLAVR